MPHRTIAEKDLPNDIGKNRHVFCSLFFKLSWKGISVKRRG